MTPLHEASFYGYDDTARLLIESGAKTSIKAVQDLTPLHNAASSGQSALVSLLIEHGTRAILFIHTVSFNFFFY